MIKLVPILIILLFSGIFFKQTLLSGKLPVPSDTLVGMYHPWLDFIAKEYPAGLPYKNFLITDPIRQQIPWRKLAIDSIQKGNFNPWNLYSFSGTPLAANIQSGFFYPFNILFFFLPFPVAWSVLIMLQQILAGIFFYLFLKSSLKLSIWASVFGAVCFMFCGFMTVWLTWGTIGQTLLWLPLSLVLSDILLTTPKTKTRITASISLGLVLATQYFAGHSQIFLYSFSLFIAYVFFRFFNYKTLVVSRKKIFFGILISLALFILLTSIHWMPFLSELPSISRLHEGALTAKEGFFIPFQNLLQFIAPDFFGNPATLNYWGIWNYGEFSGYIGIAGLFFVFFSIFSKKKHEIIFWFVITIIGLLFALPTPVSTIPYNLRISILSSLQPTRLLSVVDFCLCILAAIGLEAWINNYRKKQTLMFIVLSSSFFVLLWYVVKFNLYGITQENLEVTSRNIIFPSLIYVLVIVILVACMVIKKIASSAERDRNDTQKIVPIAGAIIIIGIAFFDLTRFGWKFTPFTDASLFFPKTEIILFLEKQPKPFRITSIDDRIMPPNVSAYYGIESIAGYDPLYDSRYEKFIAAMERGEPNIKPPYGFNRIITPKNINSPLFRLLGVRFVLSLTDIKDDRFTKVMQEGQTRLYEYNEVLPRAYLVNRTKVINDEVALIKEMYNSSFLPQETALVEKEIAISNDPLAESEKAGIIAYTDSQIDLNIQTSGSRFLFLGNTYNQNWKAYVNQKITPVYRANDIFMGIVVPNGVHQVSFRYE